ncbi:MAG TPA: hypothetical protein VE980_17225 [Pyrinomonadaceae bacterium]|nr:hypothetical protein [Pyrinomonadaceae bacterium]
MHNRDHVKPRELLISFRFKLPGIRSILLNLIDDHVKHASEHVKLRRDRVVLGRDITEPSVTVLGSVEFTTC